MTDHVNWDDYPDYLPDDPEETARPAPPADAEWRSFTDPRLYEGATLEELRWVDPDGDED